MERSVGHRHLPITIFLLLLLLLLLLSGACMAAAEPQCKAPGPCDTDFLAWLIGSCAGHQDHLPEDCCEGVVASVGIYFGDTVEVPCLCRVAKHHYLAIQGIDIHSILRMYPICGGVRSVGPETAEACQGRG